MKLLVFITLLFWGAMSLWHAYESRKGDRVDWLVPLVLGGVTAFLAMYQAFQI